MNDPFRFTSGSRTPRVIIVGEAWGREEAASRLPFVGASGRLLFQMLGEGLGWEPTLLHYALNARDTSTWLRARETWLQKCGILLTNVVSAHPPNNDFTHFLFPNEEAKARKLTPYHGIHPRPALLDGIDNLRNLLAHTSPDLIIAAGNWPFFILSSARVADTEKGYKVPSGISNWRGSQTYTSPTWDVDDKRRLLPILHPASLLRDWGQKHITVHDLRSRCGRLFSGHLAWEPPATNDIWKPSFTEARGALEGWLERANNGVLWLANDIENLIEQKWITCIGFADGGRPQDLALCIPFLYFSSTGEAQAYWPLDEEITLTLLIKDLLEHPNVKIIGQNYIHDSQYLHRFLCIDAEVEGETMVGHHLLFPGTKKSLEMLASLYCHHYCYWKDESEGWKMNAMSAEDLWKYNCKDCRSTFEAWSVIYRVIIGQKKGLLYDQRIAEWKLARTMTLRGTNWNDRLRYQYQKELSVATAELEDWLLGAVPDFVRYTNSGKPWFSSAQMTMHILYTVLGIKPILEGKTKRPTSNDAAINVLCEREDTDWLQPLLHRLRDLRSSLVSARTFLSSKLGPTGRLHPQFNIATPETFRWSSSKNSFGEGANGQNFPKIKEEEDA